MKEQLYRLESLSPSTVEFQSLLEQTMGNLRVHCDSEEEDLPLLEFLLGIEKSKEAAASFQRTKMFVPTMWLMGVRVVFQSTHSSLLQTTLQRS